MKRVIANVVVGFSLAAVVTGCGGGGGAKNAGKDSATTVPRAGGTTAPTLFPTTTRKGSSKTGAKNGSSSSGGRTTSTTGPVDRRGGPKPGTYQYDTTITSGTKATSGFSGYQVVDDRELNGGWRQITSWVEGSSNERSLITWRTAGRTVEAEQKAQGKSIGPLCDWIPDYQDIVTPITVGARWSAKTSCDEGHTITRDRTFSVEVTGTETVLVGTTPVDTFVLHRKVSTVTHVGEHLVRLDEDYTEKFAPSAGVLIQTTGTDQDYLDNVPKGLRTRTRRLRSLTPDT